MTDISVRQMTNKSGNNKTRNSSRRICQGHQGTSVIGCDINVIGKESAIHSDDEHRTKSHQSNGCLAITSDQTDTDKTGSGQQRCCLDNSD